MKRLSIAVALSAALALTACGTTEENDEAPAAAASGECADDTTATSTEPVELTDGFGRTVTLDAPAKRIAVLEWQQIEDALSLCVTPVAVADAAGYGAWNTAEKLPADGVVDVGTRGEPNHEALLGTNPDLIIVEAYSADDENIKALEKYDIPVLATKGADAADPIAQMRSTFELIAEATGRGERAEAVLEQFDTKLADAKEKVADADLPTTEFVYFDGWVDGGNISIRPFGQGALVSELGEALGLTNAWTGEVDPAYGLGQTDVEGFTKVGDATLLYTGTIDPEAEDVNERLAANPIWKKLPSVEAGNAHAFPAGIWTFGGPRSAEQVIDAYLGVLVD
ncbi:iron-siderophore ABC transporter substrate-binding protein [Nocardioides dubius]|uniref:Siderophore ABC transporter substrate-binding protein CdtB n=1 Tax=Nocardioides dubius TaxID=317019 RepID=A0ABN1TNK4_9ACTN